jgi:hypothetical protein
MRVINSPRRIALLLVDVAASSASVDTRPSSFSK